MKPVLALVTIAVTLIAIYGLWIVGKKWNYYFGYQSQVEQTVNQMVKPECLQ